jgi:hypothetical protein
LANVFGHRVRAGLSNFKVGKNSDL